MSKPKRVLGLGNSKYFESPGGPGLDTDMGSTQYTGGDERLKDSYSRVAHQDAPDPVAYTQSKRALKGGGFEYGEKKYIYDKVEDNRTFEAPPVNTPTEAAPETMPEQVEEPKVIQSERVQKAQDLVDKYTADITGGNSIYNTQVFSPPPNLNTQTEGSADTTESNTYIDPKYSLDTPGKDAADAFLKSKKLELASGLNLQ